MRIRFSLLLLSFLFAGLVFSSEVSAELGVGIGAGKVEFNEPLNMGGVYVFPPITIINTGDEAAEYEAGIDFKEDQPRLSPSEEWFSFEPKTFHLEPGQSQVVNLSVNIPLKTTPGDYFAYLEGHPVKNTQSTGGAVIGISAATKMYFTIAPSNIFQAGYYRIASIVKNNAPWSYVILVVIFMSMLVTFFRKYFAFNIGISRKSNEKKTEDDDQNKNNDNSEK